MNKTKKNISLLLAVIMIISIFVVPTVSFVSAKTNNKIENIKQTKTTSKNVSLKWTTITNAQKYDVYFYTLNNKLYKKSNSTKPFGKFSLAEGKKFYVKIRAKTKNGYTNWSKKKKIYTLHSKLSNFKQTYYYNNYVTFEWTSISNACYYIYLYDEKDHKKAYKTEYEAAIKRGDNVNKDVLKNTLKYNYCHKYVTKKTKCVFSGINSKYKAKIRFYKNGIYSEWKKASIKSKPVNYDKSTNGAVPTEGVTFGINISSNMRSWWINGVNYGLIFTPLTNGDFAAEWDRYGITSLKNLIKYNKTIFNKYLIYIEHINNENKAKDIYKNKGISKLAEYLGSKENENSDNPFTEQAYIYIN